MPFNAHFNTLAGLALRNLEAHLRTSISILQSVGLMVTPINTIVVHLHDYNSTATNCYCYYYYYNTIIKG